MIELAHFETRLPGNGFESLESNAVKLYEVTLVKCHMGKESAVIM